MMRVGWNLRALLLGCLGAAQADAAEVGIQHHYQTKLANTIELHSEKEGSASALKVVELERESHRHAVQLTSAGRQLLRREGQSSLPDCPDDVAHDSHSDCIKRRSADGGNHGQISSSSARMSAIVPHEAASLAKDAQPLAGGSDASWRMVSIGDVQAVTVHGGYIYAVGFDPLAVLHRGIFRQTLNDMTPYSNWTLIGYGSMSSIAIHSIPSSKIMYGVGNNSWLYKQDLKTMSRENTWTVASVFPLKTIAIDGDIIYGVSPDHANEIYKTSLYAMAEFSGWQMAGTGPVKSMAVASGVIFALFDDGAVYNKLLNAAWEEESPWALKDQANMLSITILGDTLYAASSDHRVYREPLKVNKRWAAAGLGPVRSLAINTGGDMIYAVSSTGFVVKQELVHLGANTSWLAASAPNVSSIAIQGDTIYGVNPDDKRVYKQTVANMHPNSTWEVASACCALQIAAADGIIYAIGEDHRVYKQADVLMTPDTEWIATGKGNVFSIAIRGDTIFGIDPDGFTFEQLLSRMTIHSPWTPTYFEDALYPSRRYLSIMAHNDIMYACGEDMAVYTKLIDKAITYPPGLSMRGNTHGQALHWNLTDLSDTTRRPSSPPPTTPVWQLTTTTLRSHSGNLTVEESHSGNLTVEELRWSTPTTTSPKTQEAGIMNHYIDRYQDQRAPRNGANSVNFDKIESEAVQGARIPSWWCAAVYATVLFVGSGAP